MRAADIASDAGASDARASSNATDGAPSRDARDARQEVARSILAAPTVSLEDLRRAGKQVPGFRCELRGSGRRSIFPGLVPRRKDHRASRLDAHRPSAR